MKFVPTLIIVAVFIPILSAADWPCWRGPNHNGISVESLRDATWPAGGPRIAWRTRVGTGFSAVAVSDGRLYTLGNSDDQDTVYCLDAVKGKKVWKYSYDAPRDPKAFEGGPTATPAVDGGRVYSLGRRGDLLCLDAANGK